MQVEAEEKVELPTFRHEDIAIRYPDTSRPLPAKVQHTPHLTAFFDGGAAKKVGTGGFIVFSPEGECIRAQASFYGEELGTNNRAEARALQELMQWLVHTRSWEKGQALVVYGDSQLVINFCNRKARPAVTDLYEAMQAVKACTARLAIPVYFRHIPRERNQLADWLT
jgi:ribonuclease HI